MALIMDGKLVSRIIESELKEELIKMKLIDNQRPTLATIIVGNDPSSVTYVKMKVNACKRVGFKSIKIALSEKITTKELLEEIKKLNNDENVDGILLQHPVPKQINERKCFDAIDVKKDVDGVNSVSFGRMSMGSESFLSATPLGIKKLIEYYNIETSGKNALVIGRSSILGKPVAMMLLNKDATVTIAHSKTKDLVKICKKADIIVACVGKANFIQACWLKKGVVIIDAGYNDGNVGDVDLIKAAKKSSAYTPVPGGVGPMTIASLLSQTMMSFKKKIFKDE